MKKRAISILLIICLSLVCFAPAALAAEAPVTPAPAQSERIDNPDGSCIIITIEYDQPAIMAAATASTKSGSKTYSYYDASGNLDWQVRLNGTFTYTPNVSTVCTDVSATVSIYDTSWYTVSKSPSKAGNTAYVTAVIEKASRRYSFKRNRTSLPNM